MSIPGFHWKPVGRWRSRILRHSSAEASSPERKLLPILLVKFHKGATLGSRDEILLTPARAMLRCGISRDKMDSAKMWRRSFHALYMPTSADTGWMRKYWWVWLALVLLVIIVLGVAWNTEPPVFGDIQRISIVYRWIGLAPWPRRYDTYEVICQNQTCTATGQLSAQGAVGSFSDLNGTTSITSHLISYDAVQGMQNALTNLKPMRAAPEESADGLCEDGTGGEYFSESYPRFEITLATATGQNVFIENDAHCSSPWYIAVGLQQFVQTTGEIPTAYRSLVRAIDPNYRPDPSR